MSPGPNVLPVHVGLPSSGTRLSVVWWVPRGCTGRIADIQMSSVRTIFLHHRGSSEPGSSVQSPSARRVHCSAGAASPSSLELLHEGKRSESRGNDNKKRRG